MPPELIEPTGEILRDHPAYTVYLRERWFDEWTEQEHLYCRRVYFACGSTLGAAELEWRFGIGMRPGEATFDTVEKQDWLDQYVKIEIDQGEGEDPIVWYGVLAAVAQNPRMGALMDGDARVLCGIQDFTAYSLDFLLERMELSRSAVQKAGTSLIYWIERGLIFNRSNDYADSGNRSNGREYNGAYVFSSDLSSSGATWWSTKDILEYLLRSAITASSGFIDWKLGDKAKAALPTWDHPVLEADKRSIRSLIDQLCDRRRLLTWWIEVDDNDNVLLQAASYNKDELTLPHGGVQPANPDQVQLDFDRAVDVRCSISDSAEQRVDQVIVRGWWCTTTFTLSPADSTLDADWTSDAQTQYNAGPGGLAGVDIYEAERRVREFRAQDEFQRVYAYFRLPADFNYMAGNGQGGAKVSVFPDDTDMDFTGLYLPEFRLERSLPPDFLSGEPDDSPSEAGRPLGLIQIKDSPDQAWQHLDRLAAASETEGEGDGSGRDFSASLKVRDDVCGVIVRVSGGPGIAQHAIASEDFTPISNIDLAEDAIHDWATLIVTATANTDTRVEARYPEDPDADLDCIRRVVVDLGETARLDYCTANTVLGHDDGDLQYPDAAYFLRDDREWMEDLARFIWEWYATPRQAIQLHLQQIAQIVERGNLINQIGADATLEEVNALVTGLDFDLVEGTTKIVTSFAELDPHELAGLAVPDYYRRRGGENPFAGGTLPASHGLGSGSMEEMIHADPYGVRPPAAPSFESLLHGDPYQVRKPSQQASMEEMIHTNPFS